MREQTTQYQLKSYIKTELEMPIGVYDSGFGGLTVYKALAAKFKNLDMIYLGDSARVPYGNKSPETIVKYSLECAKYLCGKYDISALIVACNTVSSHALDTLRDELQIPVLGVIAPGAAHAIDATANNRICIIGTHATVNSCSYIRAIKSLAGDKRMSLFQLACPLFVPLVEEAIIEGKMAETIVRETLKDIPAFNPDTLILGCTHYPVLKDLIVKFLPNVKIIDSTEYIISDIENTDIELKESGKRKILITDESPAFNSLKILLAGDTPVEKISLTR